MKRPRGGPQLQHRQAAASHLLHLAAAPPGAGLQPGRCGRHPTPKAQTWVSCRPGCLPAPRTPGQFSSFIQRRRNLPSRRKGRAGVAGPTDARQDLRSRTCGLLSLRKDVAIANHEEIHPCAPGFPLPPTSCKLQSRGHERDPGLGPWTRSVPRLSPDGRAHSTNLGTHRSKRTGRSQQRKDPMKRTPKATNQSKKKHVSSLHLCPCVCLCMSVCAHARSPMCVCVCVGVGLLVLVVGCVGVSVSPSLLGSGCRGSRARVGQSRTFPPP